MSLPVSLTIALKSFDCMAIVSLTRHVVQVQVDELRNGFQSIAQLYVMHRVLCFVVCPAPTANCENAKTVGGGSSIVHISV